jgi:atypical dual specificity phosphatase
MDAWWIDSPYILGSDNPTNDALADLRREGFGILISLLREEEQEPRYDLETVNQMGFVRHTIPVRDLNPPTVEQLVEFIRIVDELPPETKIIIHCQAGIGRTGTFAAAYWISRGMSMTEAVALVRKLRWHAIETSEQEAILEQFARRMSKLP